ncbi:MULTISPECIES: Rz-like lysis system protein LysB [Pseudomonas]|uniref:Rz-like lysis system protein LysB n=1 Tax=Pseudomonas TaxID=286 RepID=UPI0018E66358|nr:Rz-like lysis system protein LysB [Pseudomonas sp. S4_EA_1b]MBI6601665.1 LysB family phage lysis regulatory protein [Pseudomonas sp. S4_EA_1b]DAH55439.1 MAG TPA: lysis regulatory protein [Caudoviricetes sp.]
MSRLRQIAAVIALFSALALLLWGLHQRSQAEQGRTALAQEKLATVNARVERDATTITTLRTNLADERQAQTTLQQTGQDLRRELDVRKQQIKELKRENAELREWAAAQLPVAARRLRQRPAITGADAYRDWLSGRNALHPERD